MSTDVKMIFFIRNKIVAVSLPETMVPIGLYQYTRHAQNRVVYISTAVKASNPESKNSIN
jgi:hypothetical protein